ncbi:MAG: pilus assembly protein PilM, partial [Phycisphaerae bacterium]|nr:pilus assembly protein PilM [Phycisphaerae bacterium]
TVLGVKWFSGKLCPIGIDFGAESLKMVQLTRENNQLRVLAAGRKMVPDNIAGDPAGRARFFVDAVKELMGRLPFKGKKVVTSIPSESLFVQHIRMAKMTEADLAKALPWEAQGKLPYPVRDAVLRHLVASELFVDGEPKNEVILMAAPRLAVENHLSAIARAKLDVQTVLVPPLAILEAFRFLFTRGDEKDMCTLFVDIGASQTCAMITHATKIVFVKQIPVAGHVINTAVGKRLNVSRSQARRMRQELLLTPEPAPAEAADPAEAPRTPPATDGLTAAIAAAEGAVATSVAVAPAPVAAVLPDSSLPAMIETVCREETERLSRELIYCVRYYLSLFPDRAVERIVFLGGEAHHRTVCQQIARDLRLPAMLGDPMLRMHRAHEGVECGDLTPGTPVPEWAVAFGCSLTDAETAG